MTRSEVSRLLESLSLRGNHVVVHASLSSFGQVEGGARTICETLIETVAPVPSAPWRSEVQWIAADRSPSMASVA